MNEPHPFDAAMREALALAAEAAAAGEVPVGAVAVLEGRVVGRGRNRREEDRDPTAHAELLAIQDAARALGRWRLAGVTLVVTLEPCAMCAGALVLARVDRLVYGAPDPKAGAVGSLMDLSPDPRLNHRFPVERGLRADECGEQQPTYGSSPSAATSRYSRHSQVVGLQRIHCVEEGRHDADA